MNIRTSWTTRLTGAICASAMAMLGVPAALITPPAAAASARPAATLTASGPGAGPADAPGAGPADAPGAGSAGAPSGAMPMATGDRRHVRPPRLPRPCIVLRAALATTTGTFGSADETTPPDTGRIQAALDRCAGTGRAVVLAGDTAGGAANDAFLSGPLTIGRHEVLLVDDGVTLYASLNPADYQIPSQYRPTPAARSARRAAGATRSSRSAGPARA